MVHLLNSQKWDLHARHTAAKIFQNMENDILGSEKIPQFQTECTQAIQH